ncbi:MAG: iron-containing alcohol dehydrogenase [Bacteroidetes bacterium]|nr:iron-containing alcohol dehydrogenase [Bacteroidota bacterium]
MDKIFKNSKLVPYYYLGRGAFANLGMLLNAKRKTQGDFVVVVIDHYFSGKHILPEGSIHADDLVIYADTSEEPKTTYIDALTDQVKTKNRMPVAIVGIGGGSTLDVAKAISVMLTNPGKAEQYQGWDLVKHAPVYKIGVPTIAGTGAEFTRTAVLTGKDKKLGINSDYSVFDQVILDADLLETVPKEQFIYTAMDCFVHNCESLLGRINDTMTIALAEKSTQMMKEIFLGEMDLEKLLVASSLGGLAVANSSVGICHPLSYGLSIELGLHHGFAICVAFNQLEEYYPEVATFKKILEKYEIHLPKVVSDDIAEEQLERMAVATMLNEKPLSNAFGDDWENIFTKEKIKSLLRKM